MHLDPPPGCKPPQATPLPIRPRAAIAMLIGLALVLALDSGVHRRFDADAARTSLLDGVGPLW